MRRILRDFLRNDKGSVAPTVALSLFALIAAGGIAFDYARVASMDTELQNAADQAALAAASQLDGGTGAQNQARAAAQTLITNKTAMANDAGSPNIAIQNANIVFYSAYTDPTTNTVATGDADFNFVRVTVHSRTAVFAFTPIVAAFSGSMRMPARKRVLAVQSAAWCPFSSAIQLSLSEIPTLYLAPGWHAHRGGHGAHEGGFSWGPGNFGFLDQIGKMALTEFVSAGFQRVVR